MAHIFDIANPPANGQRHEAFIGDLVNQFEIWPSSFRDGSKGLVTLIAIQLLALATLAKNLS